jgi:hypothetical protein
MCTLLSVRTRLGLIIHAIKARRLTPGALKPASKAL